MPFPVRAPSPRLSGFDYSSPCVYLITVCAHRRVRALARIVGGGAQLMPTGTLVDRHWRALAVHHPGLVLDTHVVMPDHLHGILRLPDAGSGGRTLSDVVNGFKGGCTRAAREQLAWRGPLWQRGFYDRIVRSEGELEALRAYILDNPRRWALREERAR